MVKPVKILGAAALAGAAVVSAFTPSYHQQQTALLRPQSALHATLTSSEHAVTMSSSTILDRPSTSPLITSPSPNHQPDHLTTSNPNPADDWILRIYNDNINTREYVAVCLVQVVGLCESRAYFTMQDAHDNGIAKVGEYNQEVAECYEEQLVERGIMCDVVASE
jgi:ATP-dependent Clp protease adapter protein ClpS